MTTIGYALSSEEHEPLDLVRYARMAEEAGFPFALISDHFHPWVGTQGQSPFVWGVLGAIATATERLRIGTGVTCPTIRMHPAIVAHAAATAAALMPGRFFLGVGTGENLNEHVTGAHWPAADVRLDMLEEAIHIIRELWQGDEVTHRGRYYTVDHARLYTVPEQPPQLMVAASGEKAATSAGREGDGLISTGPDAGLVETFRKHGGRGKPVFGQVTVCYAEAEEDARRTAHRWWPNTAMTGELSQELPLPRHFEQAAEMVSEDDVAEQVACGPDPERHLELIRKYVDAGFDHVYIHQVGPDQEGFFRFYADEILPRLRR